MKKVKHRHSWRFLRFQGHPDAADAQVMEFCMASKCKEPRRLRPPTEAERADERLRLREVALCSVCGLQGHGEEGTPAECIGALGAKLAALESRVSSAHIVWAHD